MSRLKKIFIILIVLVLTTPTSTFAVDTFAICNAQKAECEDRANQAWNTCRANDGWYVTCYIVYNDTRNICLNNLSCVSLN